MTWDPDFGCPVHPGEPQPCVICEMPPRSYLCGVKQDGHYVSLTDEARAELREFAEYLKVKQVYRDAFRAWEAGGRVGDPPSRPVMPHTPGGSNG